MCSFECMWMYNMKIRFIYLSHTSLFLSPLFLSSDNGSKNRQRNLRCQLGLLYNALYKIFVMIVLGDCASTLYVHVHNIFRLKL